MIYGLLPAAGKSLRMGRPKLSLPLGGRTVLEHAVAALRSAGVENVVVVIGPHVSALAPLAATAGAAVSLLSRETADMRATVQEGLRWLEDRFHPAPADAWLLVPADHPTLKPEVIRELLAAHESQPNYSIMIPTYEGQRGHPALIAWKHVPDIRALPADQGINRYLRQWTAETLELPVHSPTVLYDLDVPEDYERLRREWEHGNSFRGGKTD